jgi:hypothetical protein
MLCKPNERFETLKIILILNNFDFYRISEKIATPTSVILMAINTVTGETQNFLLKTNFSLENNNNR